MPRHEGLTPAAAPARNISFRRRLGFRKAAGKMRALLSSRTLLGAFVVVVALLLIVLHSRPALGVRVDEITLSLLIFASLPWLSQIVTSFKAGNVEVAFRDMSVHDQLFVFLDGIATKRQWTFFAPRSGEEHMGPAFTVLTEQLLIHCRPRLIAQLRAWLGSEDVNQRWFAAEIVGYHKVEELRRAVGRAPETQNVHHDWEAWELNCLWAKSRFDQIPYRALKNFLLETTSPANQLWVLDAFAQMVDSQLESRATFSETVATFARKLEGATLTTEERALFDRVLRAFDPALDPAAPAGNDPD